MFGDKKKYPSPYRALDTFKTCLSLSRHNSQALERTNFIELVKSDQCVELVGRFLSGER